MDFLDKDGSIGYFGDFRRMKVGQLLLDRIIEKGTGILKHLASNRAEQVRFSRFLWNGAVKDTEIKQAALNKTKSICGEGHVLAIQDTTQINLDRLRSKITDLGVLTNETGTGLFCHPTIAVDPSDDFILGICGLKMWSRDPKRITKKNKKRKPGPIENKETFRWIEGAIEAKETLSSAKKITVVGDREFDIYDAFYLIPDSKTDLLVRSNHNRDVWVRGEKTSLKTLIESLEVQDTKTIKVPYRSAPRVKCRPTGVALNKKKKHPRLARDANLELRYTETEILKPKNHFDKNAPDKIKVSVIEIREIPNSKTDKPINWRLITTHKIESVAKAWEIVSWYKKRWHVEQLFRAAKKGGMQVENIEITRGDSIRKLVTFMLLASVKIMQLTLARDKSLKRTAEGIFSDEEVTVLESLNKKYEGRTDKQKNPYEPNTLGRAAWIIGRIGGWKGYASEGPAGPNTLMRGLKEFGQFFSGWLWRKNVCTS